MRRFALVRTCLLSSCCGLMLLPSYGYAQEASEEPTNQEIIVTATRDLRDLKDVPMSVDVATGEELQKFNLFDAKDISRLAPGLELTNTSGRNNTTSLRGVSFDPDQGTGPSVQIYFNEAPVDAQYAFTALYDINQIEVLRGPQGALRGTTAPAGAITIATRRPSFTEFDGYVQATATNRHGYNIQGGVSLPFSEKFAVRVAMLVDGNRLNQVYNVTRGQHSRSTTQSGRITLDWRPSTDFEAVLSYQYLHADNRQFQQVLGQGNNPITLAPFQVGTQPIAPGFSVPIVIFGPASVFNPAVAALQSGPAAAAGDYISTQSGLSRFQNDSHLVNLNLKWDLGPATLSFIGAHTYALLDQQRDLDVGNALVERTFASVVRTPNKVDSAEILLTSNATEGLIWGAGMFYSKRGGVVTVNQDSNQYFTRAVPLSSDLYLPIDTRIVVPVDSKSLSFSGNLRYKSGPLTIEGALRYSINKANQTTDIFLSTPGFTSVFDVGGGAALLFPVSAGQVFPPNGSIVQAGIPAALQRRTYKPLTGMASISYQFTPDLTAYAAYGRSFRSGSAGVSVPVGISDDLVLSEPEKTDSFEVGLKGTTGDRRIRYSISAYYQKYDGYLARFDGIFYNCRDVSGTCSPSGPAINNATDNPPTNGSFSFNYNGDATVKGVEATLDGQVTNNWDIGINLSYAHGRYNKAPLPCNDYNGSGTTNTTGTPRITGSGNVSYCLSNGRLAEAPDFSASVNSEIRFPVGNVTPFVRGLMTHRPGFHSTRTNFTYASRQIVDLYLGVQGEEGRWALTAFAKNVLNQQRITNISDGTARVGPYDSGYRLINTTNPREFGITSSFRF